MAEAIPETIDKATHAVEVAAKPQIFPVVIAFAALAACGALVYRNEVRTDAQIEVMKQIAASLRDVRLSLREKGVKIAHYDEPKVQASGLGGADE